MSDSLRMRPSPLDRTRSSGRAWLLLLVVLICAAPLAGYPGMSDIDRFWLRWMRLVGDEGLARGYSLASSDYPPGAFIVLYLSKGVARWLGCSDFAALKGLLFAFLAMTGATLLVATRSAMLAGALIASLAVGTVAHAYLDILYMPTLLWSLECLRRGRLSTFAATFAISCATKWQPVIILPFLLAFVLGAGDLRAWRAWHWRTLAIRVAPPALMVVAAAVAPFGLDTGRAFKAALSHDYLSGLAFNFNWLLTCFLHVVEPERWGALDGGRCTLIRTRDLKVVLLPRLTFVLLYGWVLLRSLRERDFVRMLEHCIGGFAAYVVFNVGVHENHFLTLLPLTAYLAALGGRARSFWLCALVANANLVLLFGISGADAPDLRLVAGFDVSWIVAAASTCLCVLYVLHLQGRAETRITGGAAN